MASGNRASVDVPIPTRVVTAVAARNLIDESDLWDGLETIHRNVVDGADAVVDHYESRDGPEAVDVADGLATVLFVDAATWDQSARALPEDVRTAAKAAHAEFARELDVDDATLAAYDPLVVPSRAVGELVRAGLSQRQAEVQVLRDAGYTQREVGDRLGMATNTVKVHCHRIDAKVEDAKRLVGLVEG